MQRADRPSANSHSDAPQSGAPQSDPEVDAIRARQQKWETRTLCPAVEANGERQLALGV